MANLDPYAPPAVAAQPPAQAPVPAVKRRYGALIFLGAAVALAVASGFAAKAFGSDGLITVGGALVGAAALWGGVRGVMALVAGPGRTPLFVIVTIAAILANAFMVLFGSVVALLSVTGLSRGRQLRRWGRVLLPPVLPGEAWAAPAAALQVPDPLRAPLARQWRENGRTEHASVAAFARLTLDLIALGAPPALVASANRDALDEIRHAELCFAIARALDGESHGPGAFPAPAAARTLPRPRSLALAKLAVASLVDGALHEGVSARIVARLAKVCQEPTIRAACKTIAADEGRHAAHGWDVVDWCLAEGGNAVARALEGALRVLPTRMHSPLPEAAASGAWERWGIHGHALEAAEYAEARAHVVRRLGAVVGGGGGRAFITAHTDPERV